MKDELTTILRATGLPARLQGSVGQSEKYPKSFWTFWNFETPEKYYDNIPVDATWGFWLFFFSDDPRVIDPEVNRVIKTLRSAGWIVAGKGEDALSDEPTHTGRRLTVYKREIY